MPAALELVTFPELDTPGTLLLIGRREQLRSPAAEQLALRVTTPEMLERLIGSRDPGPDGRISRLPVTDDTVHELVVGVLPEACSRHNAPSRAWAVHRLCLSGAQKGDVHIVVMLEREEHAFASAMAVARALPTFSASTKKVQRTVRLSMVAPGGHAVPPQDFRPAAKAVRWAASLVDAPPNQLGTQRFVALAEHMAERHSSVTCSVVRGEELAAQGLGALYAVGKGASQPPALVVLDYAPDQPTGHVGWLGKGIVFDTGGHSIKSKTGMVGMKMDMGGAGAVLAAFDAAVSLRATSRITAILCIAENAIGNNAVRVDDIIEAYSGRSIEINNTDAEGRLVLADGLAWMARHRDPDLMVDLATLTGAQGIATGQLHAGAYCNDEALEQLAVIAGRRSGDLVHPLPYAPELFRREFNSQVADIKNSVKNRNNAQSSCAGEFLRVHLGDWKKPWLHIDMAGPATHGSRGTGYGVGLLLTLVGVGAPLDDL